MAIRQLTRNIINRIAAGEVIERPASVVKELCENAIDAGANLIEIRVEDGGLSLIQVSDNGSGMSLDDLSLAVERHATSKLLNDDLLAISTLGFRGEALPSIGSIAKLTLRSRLQGSAGGHEITVDGGRKSEVKPVAINEGTIVEVRDLFYATPARLKFQKSERAEHGAINDIFKRLSLAHPGVSFRLNSGDRPSNFLPQSAIGDAEGAFQRIAKIMGGTFAKDAIEISACREDLTLKGFVSLPTLHRANSLMQFFFVNGRPVRDKQILGAIRGAYSDFLPSSRYPLICLFLEVPPTDVDVNVHPAKAEVRFKDPQLVRGLIVGSLKQALSEAGHLASAEGGEMALDAFEPNSATPHSTPHSMPHSLPRYSGRSAYSYDGFNDRTSLNAKQRDGEMQAPLSGVDAPSAPHFDRDEAEALDYLNPLGAAKAHLFENYIMAQTDDGMVIVDAHAAHERIVYEKLKKRVETGHVPTQGLLIPIIVELDEAQREGLLAHSDELKAFGLYVESFGPCSIAVQEVPELIANGNIKALIHDLADEIAEMDQASQLNARLDYVCATIACHGSVRSGRRLQYEEMNALLRQMEETPHSGQCNHGRPTYIELKLKDIERLFGR